jgi:hypothetical protein
LHLLKFQQPFNPEVFAKEEAKMKRKQLARLEAMATALNYRLVRQALSFTDVSRRPLLPSRPSCE